jgi:hypothetical protein
MSVPYPGHPLGLDVGDRVVATNDLGGFLRPAVRQGTRGLIVARSPDGTLRARFANGRTLAVQPDEVTLAGPTGADPDRSDQ